MNHSEIIRRCAPLLRLIRDVEGRGDYGIVYLGIPEGQRPKDLQNMTVAEVMQWQRRVVKSGAKSSAAGAYQIIRSTLASIQDVVRPGSRFSPATQDFLAAELLRRRGVLKFLSGKMSAESFMVELAREWASFPVPRDMKGFVRNVTAGQSYYAGDGLNKALVGIGYVRSVLDSCDRTPAPQPAPEPVHRPDPAPFSIWKFLGSILKGLMK